MARDQMLEEYRKRILEETEFVRLEGILPSGAREVPLDKVYIRLHAITEQRRKTLQEAELDQLRQATKEGPGRSQDDYFAFIQRLGDFYYYLPGSRMHPAEGESIDSEDALKENPRMVILGAPGSGKSTFLRFLARRCASDPGGPIPIILSLRKYAEHLGNGGEMSLQDFALKDQGRFEPHLKKAIESGAKVLWLLDGLDEARGWQGDIRRSVRDIPGDLILTSRPVGYSREGLEKLPHFEVLPLSPDDRDKFLQDWFGHLSGQLGKPGDWTEERVTWLLDQLSRKKGIEPLARNPLLLTFLVILAGQDPLTELPERRSDIFEKYVMKLLLSWEDRRLPRQGPTGETGLETGPYKGSQAQDILLRGFHWMGWFLHLSYYSGCSENVCGAVSYRPFREDLELYLKEKLVAEEKLSESQAKGAAIDMVDFWHKAGILDVWALEGWEYLAFRHLAFQEYASARILLDIWKKDPGKAWSFLQPRLHHRAWQQPVLLMAGKMEPKEIDSLLERIRKNHGLWQEALLLLLGGLGERSPEAIWRMLARKSPYERILHLDLQVCLDVLNECGYARYNWNSQSADLILDHAAQIVVNSITWDRPLWNHLLGRNMPKMNPLLEHVGETKDVFYSSVLPLLKYSDSGVRSSAAQALSKLGDPRAVLDFLVLLKDSDSNVQRSAAQALIKLGNNQAIPELIVFLKDSDSSVRSLAAKVLGKLRDTHAVPDLLIRLKDSDPVVRSSASEALGEIGDYRAVPDLLALLKDSDPVVRSSASEALGEIGDYRVIPDLLILLKDLDPVVRSIASEALGEMEDCRAVPDLLFLLKDSSHAVRKSAVKALGKIGDPRAIPNLLILLKDSNHKVRRSAVYALGAFGDARMVPDLLVLLRDPDRFVRRSTVNVLGKLGDVGAVSDLLSLLKDSDLFVLESAIRALGEIGDDRAIPDLIFLLKNSDWLVKDAAKRALCKIDNSRSTPDLLVLLADSDQFVRMSAAIALGVLRDVRAVPELLALLKNSTVSERFQALEVLISLGYFNKFKNLNLLGYTTLKLLLAQVGYNGSATANSHVLDYIASRSADLALKEMPLIDPLQSHQRSGIIGVLDSFKISIGLSGPGIGIDLGKIRQWLKNK